MMTSSKKMISVWFVLAAIYLAAIAVQSNIYMISDVSWLLHVTQSFLQGGHYNQDFFETNPPMIIFLYIPPTLLHHYFSFDAIGSLRFYVFIVATIILCICNDLLTKLLPSDGI